MSKELLFFMKMYFEYQIFSFHLGSKEIEEEKDKNLVSMHNINSFKLFLHMDIMTRHFFPSLPYKCKMRSIIWNRKDCLYVFKVLPVLGLKPQFL